MKQDTAYEKMGQKETMEYGKIRKDTAAEQEMMEQDMMEQDIQADRFLGEFIFLYSPAQKPQPLLLYEEEQKRLERLTRLWDKGQVFTIVLSGEKGCGRKLMVMNAARTAQKPVLFVHSRLFLKKLEEGVQDLLPVLLWKVQRVQGWLCFYDLGPLEESFEAWERLHCLLLGRGFPCFVTARPGELPPQPADGSQTELVLCEPDTSKRAFLWEEALKGIEKEAAVDVNRLSERYAANRGQIRCILRKALLNQAGFGRAVLLREDLKEAADALDAGKLGAYAREIPCVFTWQDLAVDPRLKEELKELCSQVKYKTLVGEEWGFYEKRPYGNGLCTLFYGPPGTGKTMAAQVIANELGMELYRVDVSQMSSKYIGETQKNISYLFDRARDMRAILFFDEADAFFSRRTEVREANDRNANGEIGHLLQKLEEYDGVTILATNQKNEMDDAFKRRIRRMIQFRLPDCTVRKALWKLAFPPKAPLGRNMNFDFWAEQFELSGSEIKEAAMQGAFLAAGQGSEIKKMHIEEALKVCLAKYGRILTKQDFTG